MNEQDFWKRVLKTDTCWLWQGGKNRKGYGIVVIGQTRYFTHRYSYTLFKGTIPEGMTIDHLCLVENCVNPNHMKLVTPEENNRRKLTPEAIAKRKHEMSTPEWKKKLRLNRLKKKQQIHNNKLHN